MSNRKYKSFLKSLFLMYILLDQTLFIYLMVLIYGVINDSNSVFDNDVGLLCAIFLE